ncbi:MAG: alpha/beta fold hydrolase [Alcanivorax sp.]|uniref:Alpha/beta hydrolase n=1 Tax=Alloalcanivorax marinus TaxID=1177169 RepID=A0A9Q3UMK3_9GAMM|nr:alpha/beta fold hydrolase [Alloalcanivorax marinus]MBM7333402.1 alpha/beta fold hydrolase [Alloalcanivorax marinus]MCC4308528.1 alpha/beta hydrolase [Alloalcanivorax marinus]MCU5785406.1 alpha/beta hydrolase [Alloalcanivorax marinus]
MTSDCFELDAGDGHTIGVHEWRAADPIGTLIWLHGMGEHGARYQALGEILAEHGWNLYCPDHRGHGLSQDADQPPGHFGDRDGWAKVMGDVQRVVEAVAERHPGPLVLGGHSMGSFIALAGAERFGERLDGLVLCGSDYHSAWYYRSLLPVIRWQQRRQGPRGQSALIDKLTFRAWARSVRDARTDFDWLSHDHAQVDAYIDDPKCGFQCTNATWVALVSALARVQSHGGLAALPARLPILLLGGRQDPMSNFGKGMDRLENALRRRGLPLQRLDCPEGRHEILNDYCAPEVRQVLVEWLNRRL